MGKILLLSFCLMSVMGYGQLINKNYTWNDLEIEMTACKSPACISSILYNTHSYHIGKDTLLNSKMYNVLIDTIYSAYSYGTPYGDMAGCIREDIGTKKTYFISKYSREEIMLYDFSLSIGEVFTINSNWGGDFRVTNRDSMVYLGQKRLTITLSNEYGSVDWIEGIGSKQGFLYVNYYDGTLLCLNSNNVLIYKNDAGYKDCIIRDIIGNSSNESIQNEVKVYPNPASDYVNIEKEKTIESIKIIDLCGRSIAQFKPNERSCQISLVGMEKGIYLIDIDSSLKKLVIK